MACKKCNDCKDNGCAPTVYPKCILMDKAYPCLGITVGKTGKDLFDAIEAACATWGGGNLTFNNGLTKTGTVVQLGAPLVRDTVIITGAFNLAIASAISGIQNVIEFGPSALGAGIPGSSIGIIDSVSGDGTSSNQYLVAGVYTGLLSTVNGVNIASLLLQNDLSSLRFSTDSDVTYVKVTASAVGIELDGIGLPSVATATQIQEDLVSVVSAATLPITTDANTYQVTGNTGPIGLIDSTPAIGTIQPGTKITLEFTNATPPTVTHTTALTQDSIRLNGCANFTPSQYDTLTLMFNGVQWNEVGRKMCNASFNGAWVSPDLIGNVFVSNNLNTRYRKVDGNHVELNIYLDVDIPNVTFSRALYTLPVGFRPTIAPQYFHINVYDVGAPATGYKAVVEVQITGVVSITVLDTIVGGTDITVLGMTGIFPLD